MKAGKKNCIMNVAGKDDQVVTLFIEAEIWN